MTTTPSSTKRERQGERSREEILNAAERLMSAKGYAATSISDLARESSLPASSIYWHFSSKSGVLAAVMARGAARYFNDVRRLGQGLSVSDPQQGLRDWLSVSRQMIRDHPRFLRLFLLLLLGSEGEHAQQETVGQVRVAGQREIRLGLAKNYESWGPELAALIADELAEFGVVLFDGLFIAAQTQGGEADQQLLDQSVIAIHAVALAVRDRHLSAGDDAR